MDQDDFLTLALRNPVNRPSSTSSIRTRAARRLDGVRMPGADGLERLTERAVDYGINDYDVFYFDPDTSWEAEDAVTRN